MSNLRKDSESQTSSVFPNQVVYQIFVRSFADSNHDGIGDFNGIRNKLPYLSTLGIGAIWLTPVFKAISYHKYDVTDYYETDPEFGTIAELKELVDEAHKLNIKIILDFVANHTSDHHPWFKEAGKGNEAFRDFYCWSNDASDWNKEPDHWHWVNDKIKGKEKYYGMFWRGMPDLNYDNKKVRSEILKAAIFWISECNIDGYRLDAASNIYPHSRKEKIHTWWKHFAREVRSVKHDFYLVGEIWGDAKLIAPYLKAGLNAGFNFSLWFNIKESIEKERNLITKNLLETYRLYSFAAENFCDAIMLSNHDNPRIMDEVNGNLGKAKLAAAILLTLPFTPFIYYGDEMGMMGAKPDEHIREPFLWSKNDPAKCTWEPNFHNASTPDVEFQESDLLSIFNTYKKLIAFRNAHAGICCGTFSVPDFSQEGLLIFERGFENKRYLIIHNLRGKETECVLNSIFEKREFKFVFKTDENISANGKILKFPPHSSFIYCG